MLDVEVPPPPKQGWITLDHPAGGYITAFPLDGDVFFRFDPTDDPRAFMVMGSADGVSWHSLSTAICL